jgi:hypothetical protein
MEVGRARGNASTNYLVASHLLGELLSLRLDVLDRTSLFNM